MHQHCRDVHYRGQRQVRHIVYINIDTNINTPYLSTHHLYQYQYQYQCTQSIPPLYLYQYTTHIAETSITVDNVRLTSSLPLCSFPTTLMCHILYPPPPPPILGLWSTVDMSNKRPMTRVATWSHWWWCPSQGSRHNNGQVTALSIDSLSLLYHNTRPSFSLSPLSL